MMEPRPEYVYDATLQCNVPLEHLDKTQGDDRFRGNYNLLIILQHIKHTSRKILQLHNEMKSKCNFITSFNTFAPFRKPGEGIIPLCHYVVLCNYIKMAKTLSFKYPLFRRNGYTEDTDLHYYLNFWYMLRNFVDESYNFYHNVEELSYKSERERSAIIRVWTKHMAINLFKLRKKIHILPEYCPIAQHAPYPPDVAAALRKFFDVGTPGNCWEEFQDESDYEASEDSDDESDEDSQEQSGAGFHGVNAAFEPKERKCDCPTIHLAINTKINNEWKKHKIDKCLVCNRFQHKLNFPLKGIPYGIYMLSTQSENGGHYCRFPRKMEMKDGESSEDCGYIGDNEDSEYYAGSEDYGSNENYGGNEDFGGNEDYGGNVDFGGSEDYGGAEGYGGPEDYGAPEEYGGPEDYGGTENYGGNELKGEHEEPVANEDNGCNEATENTEPRKKYVLTVPNHTFGTITNARIINALIKGLDPLAEFQNPNYVHADQGDYKFKSMKGCIIKESFNTPSENTNRSNPSTSSSNVGNTKQETVFDTSENSDSVPENNTNPGQSINSENLLEFVQQGWHDFPLDECGGYMFPTFVRTMTRYLYDMEPEDKEIFDYYKNILLKSCEILTKKAFKAHQSTALYKMRFHLKLMPKIYKRTLKGLEQLLEIGLQVIAYDITNVIWTKRLMKDEFYYFANLLNYESLSLLETAIHGVPGSCFSHTEWNIWLRIVASISMKLLNKFQFHITGRFFEIL